MFDIADSTSSEREARPHDLHHHVAFGRGDERDAPQQGEKARTSMNGIHSRGETRVRIRFEGIWPVQRVVTGALGVRGSRTRTNDISNL